MLSKTEIARRQLGAALALFIDDADPIAVHSLACGGAEIAEHLSVQAAARPFRIHAMETFPDMTPGEFWKLRNKHWNAFKHFTTHAGEVRNDESVLANFSDEHNDHILFVGWHDYMMAAQSLPVEAQAFQLWYYAKYPFRLKPGPALEAFRRGLPDMTNRTRGDQKAFLRERIVEARQTEALMNDPRTERRPLLLPNDL